jgi:D-alanyl-D-alanine carboxypeptidase
MNHTAGLSDYLSVGTDAEMLAFYRGRPDTFTPENLLQLTRDEGPPPSDPPFAAAETALRGTYSNAGYILLGMLLEAVTGDDYEAIIRREILEPLGLERVHFATEGARSPRQGYAFDEPTELQGTLAWSAGAIIAAPADLAEFLYALCTGLVYEDPVTLTLQRGAHISLTAGAPYGLGLQTLDASLGLNGDYIGHAGQTFGFRNDPFCDVSTKAVVIVNVSDFSAHRSDHSDLAFEALEILQLIAVTH